MDQITAIEKSLSVFVWGIIGVLPVVGLLPAVHALVSARRVRSRYGRQWNPALAYLRAGAVLALLGVLSSILTIAVVSFVVANSVC